ncbi:MAG: hypothetical protein RI900_1966 [Actinomycetota bacterium]|jgi:hypothetical protein
MTDLPPPVPPPPTSVSVPHPSGSSLSKNQIIALAAGALVVVGSLLPWAKVLGFISVSGTDGDGKITLVLGALAIAGLFVRKASSLIGVAVIFLLSLAIGVYDFVNVSNKITEAEGEIFEGGVSVGIGLYLVIAGGLIGLIGTFLHRSDLERATRTSR